MKFIKNDKIICMGVQKVIINEDGVVTIDGVAWSLPMTIEAEAHTGFLALESLEPMFKHMKCWANHDGEECAVCPVGHDGVCGIMGIKDAAEKEAAEKERQE